VQATKLEPDFDLNAFWKKNEKKGCLPNEDFYPIYL